MSDIWIPFFAGAATSITNQRVTTWSGAFYLGGFKQVEIFPFSIDDQFRVVEIVGYATTNFDMPSSLRNFYGYWSTEIGFFKSPLRYSDSDKWVVGGRFDPLAMVHFAGVFQSRLGASVDPPFQSELDVQLDAGDDIHIVCTFRVDANVQFPGVPNFARLGASVSGRMRIEK